MRNIQILSPRDADGRFQTDERGRIQCFVDGFIEMISIERVLEEQRNGAVLTERGQD